MVSRVAGDTVPYPVTAPRELCCNYHTVFAFGLARCAKGRGPAQSIWRPFERLDAYLQQTDTMNPPCVRGRPPLARCSGPGPPTRPRLRRPRDRRVPDGVGTWSATPLLPLLPLLPPPPTAPSPQPATRSPGGPLRARAAAPFGQPAVHPLQTRPAASTTATAQQGSPPRPPPLGATARGRRAAVKPVLRGPQQGQPCLSP